MGFNNKSVSILFFLILFQLIKYSQTKASSYTTVNTNFDLFYETVDSLRELIDLKWEATDPLKEAESSAGLPGELSGKIGLNGSGIIYVEGARVVNQAVYKFEFEDNFDDGKPGQLYIKYYSHFTPERRASSQFAYGLPALKPDVDLVKILPATAGFQWEEIVISLDMAAAVYTGIELGCVNFLPGEFLLIEKMAVIHGRNLSMEEIRQLFKGPVRSHKVKIKTQSEASQTRQKYVRQLRGPRLPRRSMQV